MIVMDRPFDGVTARQPLGLRIDVKARRDDVQSAIVRRARVVRQTVICELMVAAVPTTNLTERLALGVAAAVNGRTQDLTGMSDEQLIASLCS